MSEAPPEWSSDAAGHFLLRFARLLLTAGADSELVQRRVDAIASRIGVGAQLFIGSERLVLMVEAGGSFRTRIGHAVGGFGIDASRLAALDALARSIDAAQIDAAAAERRLADIEQAGGGYAGWLVVLAVAATAASLTRLFGAAWPVVGAAFIAGLANAAVRRWFTRRKVAYVVTALITATVSGLVGALVLRGAPELSPAFALTAAGMILVPGVPLINGVVDLVNGHAAMAVARCASGLVALLAIGTGLFIASVLSGATFPVGLAPGRTAVAEDLVFSGVAAFGFAMLFNAPRRAIVPIILCGATTHAGRTLIESVGVEPAAATLICSLYAGLCACIAGRRMTMPWTIFAFPGVVAMVPGSYAFRAAIGALRIMDEGARATPMLVAETLSTGLTAVVLTAAIAAGLTAVAPLAHARGSARL